MQEPGQCGSESSGVLYENQILAFWNVERSAIVGVF